MTRITDDTADLEAALEDDGLILLLLSGGAETDAEQVYEYITSEMELEEWVRVFLVESLEAVGEERSEEWFDSEEERFCCIYNDTGNATRGSVDQLLVDGEPDAKEIGEVLDTVPGSEEAAEEEVWEEGEWREGKWKGAAEAVVDVDEDEEEEDDDDDDDDEEEEEDDDDL